MHHTQPIYSLQKSKTYKRAELQKKLLEKRKNQLRTSRAEYYARIDRLLTPPESHSKATNFIDMQYMIKKGKLVKRPFDALRKKNTRKSTILSKVTLRIEEEEKKVQQHIQLLENNMRTIRERINQFERRHQAIRKTIAETRAFKTQLSNPLIFDTYADTVAQSLFEYYKRKNIKVPYFERISMDYQESGKQSLSTTRALGGIVAQLAKKTGFVPTTQIPEAIPQLFKKAGIKRILEIGPSGYGLVDILAASGVAHTAGIELSAIDIQFKEERLAEMKKQRIITRIGSATDVAQHFPGKKFDVIVAVGVLGSGGLSGATIKDTPASYAVTSHRIARSAIQILSENKNACFVAAPILGATTLRKKAVERFATVEQWSGLSLSNVEHAKRALLRMPQREQYGGIRGDREYGRAVSDWYDKNRREIKYTDALISGAPSLVVLTRKA